MPKKLILLLILSGLLLGSGQPVLANREFKTKLEKLTAELTAEVTKKETGYIIKKTEDKVYINVGHKSTVKVGDEFKVVRQKELLTDPLTGVGLGRINQRLARIKVTDVKEKFSAAQVDNYYFSTELQPGDKIVPVPYRVGILEFSGAEASGLETAVYNQLVDCLETDKRTVVVSDKLSQLAEKLSTAEKLTKETQKLISESLDLDLLITGEIYQAGGKTFVHGKLYNNQIKNIQTEAVVNFSADNQLVKYYQIKNKDISSLVPKLLTSNNFNYQALSISAANINKDKKTEIILATNQGLKILAYEQELQTKKTIKAYTRTKYDDYKIVAGKLTVDSSAKIWGENHNQLVEISRQKGTYNKRQITDFSRNRPKLIISKGDKRYLLTRDYRHYLKFNLVKGEKYKTDFKLDLEPDEGYRVGMADVDRDKEQEVLVTVYQADNKYKIRIYNIQGELETSLPGDYGSALTTLKLDSRCLVIVPTTGEKEQKIVLYEYHQGKYRKTGEISDFKLSIKDLAVGNINNEPEKELFVLVGDEKQSKVYIYQVGSKQKSPITN